MYEKYFKDYTWAELWDILQNIPHDSYDCLWRNLLLSLWWVEPETAKNELEQLKYKFGNTPLFYFAKGAVSLVLNDQLNLKKILIKLKNFKKSEWMYQWLLLEYQGRSQKYNELAHDFKRHMINKEKWAVIPLINSMQHKDADFTAISNAMRMYPFHGDDFELLLDIYLKKEGDEKDFSYTEYHGNCHHLYYHLSIYSYKKCIDLALKYGMKAIKHKFLDNLLLSIVYPILFASDLQGDDSKKLTKDLVDYYSFKSPDLIDLKGRLCTYLAILAWINGDMHSIMYALKASNNYFKGMPNKYLNDRNERIFLLFITRLSAFWQNNKQFYELKNNNYRTIYVIGESHSLTLSNLIINKGDESIKFKSGFIMGIKMHHLNSSSNITQQQLMKKVLCGINRLGVNSVMITIGEIDCRVKEGIFHYSSKNNLDTSIIAQQTVDNYFYSIKKLFSNLMHVEVLIQNIPAPSDHQLKMVDSNYMSNYLSMIELVNYCIKINCLKYNFKLIDVYGLTVDTDGKSNQKYHLDNYHLMPSIYKELF